MTFSTLGEYTKMSQVLEVQMEKTRERQKKEAIQRMNSEGPAIEAARRVAARLGTKLASEVESGPKSEPEPEFKPDAAGTGPDVGVLEQTGLDLEAGAKGNTAGPARRRGRPKSKGGGSSGPAE